MASEGTVVVDLFGGLGNQLFQYAAGLAVAQEHESVLCVHESDPVGLSGFLDVELRAAPSRLVRSLALDRPERGSSRAYVSWRVRRQLLGLRRSAAVVREVRAHVPRPSVVVASAPGVLGLRGYFQHPSWFEAVLPEVATSLRRALLSSLDVDGAATLESLGRFAVMSFRRGDYVRIGNELGLGYYSVAMRALTEAGLPTYLVSDDPLVAEFGQAWFREAGVDVRPLPLLGVAGRVRDLLMLSRSCAVVMSNSTFCWWGVVLGDLESAGGSTLDSRRLVIAPEVWSVADCDAAILNRPGWVLV